MKCWVGSNNIVFVAVTLRKLFFEILNRSIKRTGSVELFKRNTLSSTTRLSVLFTWHPSPPPPPSKKKQQKMKTKTKQKQVEKDSPHWDALSRSVGLSQGNLHKYSALSLKQSMWLGDEK
jgi:hypothetical protein